MSDLRFQVNANNIDICKILGSLGYEKGTAELDPKKFYQFLRIVQPDITKQ